jgi:S-adenosylmethionine decarboxylase
VNGRKIYLDHDITSIQDYISDEILDRYTAYDINIVSDNIFHTKMMLKKFKLENYLFGPESGSMTPSARTKIGSFLRKEMLEIYQCKNIYAYDI